MKSGGEACCALELWEISSRCPGTALDSRCWEGARQHATPLSENFPGPCTPSEHGEQGQTWSLAVQCLLLYFLQVLSATRNYLPH